MNIAHVRLKLSPVTALTAILFVGGVIYVAATWSPSSYGYVFDLFGLQHLDTVLGKPRPIRSDEWAVITPFTQATVNNHFARFNLTSPYGEDLRSVYSMPIADWGIIFKPDMWLYGWANPAYAFSFHHYGIFAGFILGYTLLFSNVLGLTQLSACLLSGVLFFTGYVQYWWTALGPTFAVFPWLLIVLDWQQPKLLKFALFYWLATTWMLAFFYPPTFISLAFVGFLILLAFRPTDLKGKTLIYLVVASIAAAITAAVYLQDYLVAALPTIYPGQRVISMGGGVRFEQWISQFFPISQIYQHQPLLRDTNICEISVVGTTYATAVLCCLNYGRWQQSDRAFKRAVLIFSAGLLATWAWILAPLPAWLVAPLLWHRVQPGRMFFAAGLLLLILMAILAQGLGLRLTRSRVAILAAMTIAIWIRYKLNRSILEWLDIVILVAIAALLIVPRFFPSKHWNAVALSLTLAIGVAAFGTFNPIQSAWHIFNRPQTATTQKLDRQAAANPTGIVAVAGFPGATLNGWGYRSISHVLPVPKFDFFRPFFPTLPAAEFSHLFNRYAHIQLTDAGQPSLAAPDAVSLPIQAFTAATTAATNPNQSVKESDALKQFQ